IDEPPADRGWRFRSLIGNLHSAVVRSHANRRPAAAQIRGDLARAAVSAADLTLHGDRDVDVQAAVDRAGVQVCGVLLRNSQLHAAVAGFDVEPFTAPRRTIEVDIDAAVAR